MARPAAQRARDLRWRMAPRSATGDHADRTPTHGYEPTREAAMAAFPKAGGRESGHVGFWGTPEMRPIGEPIQRVRCPERSSGVFIGLAHRP
jgi:hypothetical protein